jgi:hypothetical protein
MRTLRTAAFLVAAALASAPAAPAFADQPSLTQERQSSNQNSDLVWNILGALGIFGLLGLQRQSDNDGYTDDPI